MHDMIIIIWQTVAAVDSARQEQQQQLQLQTESNDDNADNGPATGSLPAATVAAPATDEFPFVDNSLGVTLVLLLLPQPMLALQWRSQRCESVLRMHIDICIDM